MKRFFLLTFKRSWKILLILIIFLLIINCYPRHSSPSLFYTSRLKLQNTSVYNYVKFRDISLLINKCEALSTIDCLDYLHYNQSDYIESLSANEYTKFQNTYCQNGNKMLFHTFWNNPNTLDDPLLLLHIKSHLYTQNRQCSYLIIWTVPSFTGDIDQRYNSHHPYLQVRTLLPLAKELREVGVNIDSLLSRLLKKSLFVNTAVVSDAVRFVVLHKYGGMYIDVDILLLRDLQPLYLFEFAYRWSATTEYNTAVLQLYEKSNISTELINLAKQKRDPYIFFPTKLRARLEPIILNRLPCVFFDPLWLAADLADQKAIAIWKLSDNTKETFSSVFHSESYISEQGRAAFNGAFAFHWHALHRVGRFEQGSYLDQWNQFLDVNLLE